MDGLFTDYLLFKALVLVGIAAVIGAYEGWTGKRILNMDEAPPPQQPPRHMGTVEEVTPQKLLPRDRA